MYIVDGIAYAGEQKPELKVCGIKPLDNFKLWLRFNNSEIRVFDFKPLLDKPIYLQLKDETIFKEVYIDYGVPCWNDGEIDISPEFLYEQGEIVKETA